MNLRSKRDLWIKHGAIQRERVSGETFDQWTTTIVVALLFARSQSGSRQRLVIEPEAEAKRGCDDGASGS